MIENSTSASLLYKINGIICSGTVSFCVFDVVLIRFIFLQQVLTHVLEESGYTRDSLLSISDFVKVPQHNEFSVVVDGRYYIDNRSGHSLV